MVLYTFMHLKFGQNEVEKLKVKVTPRPVMVKKDECICEYVTASVKFCLKKSSLILDYEHWVQSLSRFLGSQPAMDLVINPVVGCHYFPLGLQFLFQLKRSPLGRYQIIVLVDRGTQVLSG